ncbi:MAG: CoA pyrophosphatase [Xanthomonadaceae bacterium]|nr:CoA pyrophosphatase [Xanthomonadaceae bacterium]
MTFATPPLPRSYSTAAAADPMTMLPRGTLHPLHAVPTHAPWNLEELADLLSDAPAAEAAVLVCLVPRPSGVQVLLTQRTDRLRHHAGQVSFPGGRIDRDDDGPVAAALREAEEEIGLAAAQTTPLGFLDPLVTITGFRVMPVVAYVAPEFVAAPNPDEVADVFEVDLDYLMHPAHLERIPLEYRGRRREVLQFRNSPQAPEKRIWGVTASILFNLRERLARAGEATR